MPMIGHQKNLYCNGHWSNVAKNDAPCRRTLSHCELPPNVVQFVPLIGGLCHAVDFNQMWSKFCPLLEDFVTQQTLTKCGPQCAPCQGTLSHYRLWPNVVQHMPLVGELCHAADFDQMWSDMCTLLEDFVSLQTLTKCGPKCAPCQRTSSHCGLQPNVVQTYAPCWRTLSRSGLQPNVVQTCAPWQRTLFCYGARPHLDQQCTHHQKRLVPNKQILSIDCRGTETAISYYVAIWSLQ